MCALKRPYDDRSQPRIDQEAEAVLNILSCIEEGRDTLVWSTALTVENQADPDAEVAHTMSPWIALAEVNAVTSPEVLARIKALAAAGCSTLDAAHLAFAEHTSCAVLLTCDDRLLARARRIPLDIRVLNPIEYWQERQDE